MAILFDDMLLKGVRTGQMPARTEASRHWYRNLAQTDYKKVNEGQLMKSDVGRLTTRPKIGNMYMYYYDAKHKETLPYFDRFPLVFPIAKTKDGFLGINLHYLPLQLRAKLMDGLYDIVNNEKYDESTKLKLSYNILKSAAKFKYFKPCIKRYLTKQLRSRFLYVYPSEWDMALFLPLERFDGATKQSVWKDSKKLIT